MRCLIAGYLNLRLVIDGFDPRFTDDIDYETKYLRLYLSHKTAKDLTIKSNMTSFLNAEAVVKAFFDQNPLAFANQMLVTMYDFVISVVREKGLHFKNPQLDSEFLMR